MKRFSIFLLDTLLLYGALLLTLFLRYPGRFSAQYGYHDVPFFIIFGIWLLVFYIANLYNVREFRNTIHFYTLLFRAISIASVIALSFFYLIPYFGIAPKTNLAIFIAISSALLLLHRWLFNKVIETKFRKPTLIVGLNNQSLELARFINSHPSLGYLVKTIVDVSKENLKVMPISQESFRIVSGSDGLEQIIEEEGITTVVIGPEAYPMPRVIEIFYRSLGKKISFYNLAEFYERLTGRVPLGGISQILFLENLTEGSKRLYEISKRIIDIIWASILGIFSLILLPFIALVIRLDSPGPIFYRQTRVGQKGKIFSMLKYRTMVKDAEVKTGAVWAKDNDTRVTSVGRFLRKTRLDEIPQIWNIFKGEMSLVGPRAERPEFHDVLKNEVPFYEERYLIKPGLTGLAQISGRSDLSFEDEVKLDSYYIENWSLLFDMAILVRTPLAVLRNRKAE